jgi:GMP synthase-like glutamine amidotransferase
MKPTAIFRHAASEGAGYLIDFLDEKKIPWQLICIDEGAAVPHNANQFSGLVLMGGPMSVNDPLPWIAPVLALIQQAVAQDIPVLGHCLGGQLMTRALGGVVTKNPVKEIGWGQVAVDANKEAHTWFGELKSFAAFHWHGETFSLPEGATHLLSSQFCQNQAYAMGKHLALQCHVEMTGPMIREWCEIGAAEIAENQSSPGVQTAKEMQALVEKNLLSLRACSRQLYSQWIKGLSVN